jgi:plasmid stabilization system protein ParE
MSHKIVWLPEAVSDVARLKDFIQEKNPQAAQRAASRIKEATQILKENSEVGKPVEDMISFRELLIPFGNGNYILRYREETSRVIVVRVRHSKEEF